MRVAVTRYGPPTRIFGTLYAPPARVTARYCVPLGTCTATIVASARGVPSCAATTPLIAAVVTPCADSTAGTPSNANGTSTRPNHPRLPRADRGAGAGGRQGLDRDLWHRRGPRRKNHRYRDHRRAAAPQAARRQAPPGAARPVAHSRSRAQAREAAPQEVEGEIGDGPGRRTRQAPDPEAQGLRAQDRGEDPHGARRR